MSAAPVSLSPAEIKRRLAGIARPALAARLDTDARQSGGVPANFEEYRLQDLRAYSTPRGHIIAGDGIIRRKAGTLFTGGTGLGKSVACTDIAVWLAAGKLLFGCIKVPRPVKILYLEAENDPDTLKRDTLAAVKFSGADPDLVNQNLVLQHVWGFNGSAFHEHLFEQAEKHKPDVIIIDPYQAFVDPADLNGSHAFLDFIHPIQAFMHAKNLALLLVAHTPKPAQRDSWNSRESVYLAAGSSVLPNWARTSMELMPAQQETDRFRLTFGKNAERNGLVDEHGHIVRELFLSHSGNIHEPYWRVAENQAPPTKSRYAEKIAELSIEHPSMSYAEIATKLGCSKATVASFYPKTKR